MRILFLTPASVKFPEIQVENMKQFRCCNCDVFNAMVEPKLQAKTEQVMCNMLKRAVDRAVERGYNTVRFVDVSSHSDQSSQHLRTIEMLATERKDIKVEFKGAASLEDAMATMQASHF